MEIQNLDEEKIKLKFTYLKFILNSTYSSTKFYKYSLHSIY